MMMDSNSEPRLSNGFYGSQEQKRGYPRKISIGMDSNSEPRLSNGFYGSQEQKRGHPRKISIGILADSFSHPRSKDFAEENGRVKQSDHQISPTEGITVPAAKTARAVSSQKISLATLTSMPEDQMTKPQPNGSDTLRLKLWEILGTIASPNQHVEPLSQNDDEEPVPPVKSRQNSEPVPPVKPRQNSEPVPPVKPRQNSEPVPPVKPRQNSEPVPPVKPRQNSEPVPPVKPRQNSEPVPSVKPRQNSEPVPSMKPRQNSDSIESDSEGPDPDFVVKRPATRKKTAGRLKASKMAPQQSPHHNKAGRGVTNKSFPKERQHTAVRGSSLAFTRKRCQRRSPGNIATTMATDGEANPVEGQPLKIFKFREKQVQGKSSNEIPQVQEKASEVDDEFHQSRDGELTAPERVAQQVDPRQVHIEDVNEQRRNPIYSPKIQKDSEQADQNLDNDFPAFGVEVPKESDFPDSPAIKKRRPLEESSPSSQHRANSGGADDGRPAKEISDKGIQTFRSFLSSRSNYVKSNPEFKFSGYAERPESSHCWNPKPVEEEEQECRLSLSSPEDSDSETDEEGSRPRGLGKSRIIFPEIPAVKKSGFVPHQNKKLHYEERIKSSAIPAAFLSEKVGSKLQPLSDANEGDGLARAISLLALALERIKSKMQSSVRNRSAQILTSAAEGIQLQLQTAESQIQADILKLSGIHKSKRKRVDMRYEELQGQLNAIHARFKDEVNRHLQECRSVVEGLDAHHMELKGTVEKQGVSHRKLLLEAEKTIESHLSDAERRITEVHRLAREKTIQLKRAVADCFSVDT